jgi:hypothetical protein
MIWFVRKKYGWGWTPANWQGWLIIILYLALFVLWGKIFLSQNTTAGAVKFFVLVFVQTVLLIVISYVKGEKPKWSWG